MVILLRLPPYSPVTQQLASIHLTLGTQQQLLIPTGKIKGPRMYVDLQVPVFVFWCAKTWVCPPLLFSVDCFPYNNMDHMVYLLYFFIEVLANVSFYVN